MSLWQRFRSWFAAPGTPQSCCGGHCCSSARGEAGAAPAVSTGEAQAWKALPETVIVGQILSISPHPDPKVTKVQVTRTLIAPGEERTILCGAPNIYVGQWVPVALVGTDLGEGFVIAEREIRGVTSSGMICARRELGLSDPDDSGIWDLGDRVRSALGQPLKRQHGLR